MLVPPRELNCQQSMSSLSIFNRTTHELMVLAQQYHRKEDRACTDKAANN